MVVLGYVVSESVRVDIFVFFVFPGDQTEH